MNLKMRNVFIVCLIFVILCMSCVYIGLFSGILFPNIALTNESTYGSCDVFESDGSMVTTYCVDGIFKGLPDDSSKYSLKTSIYDENGSLIDEEKDETSMAYISEASKSSQIFIISMITCEGLKNVSSIELTMYNTQGNIVFDQNLTFSMENVTIEKINDSRDYNIGKTGPS